MADGSRTVELEADAAAAEAAREAKAEVLERAAKIERRHAAARRPRPPRRKPPGQEAQWAEFVVDVWITDLELDRVRHLQAQPQPRQVAPVHHRHGHLRRGHRERRAHRPARLPRGPLEEEHRHGQAPGVQALQRDGELARHHGPDDRPQPAADAGRARPAGHRATPSTSATTTTWSTSSAPPTSGRCCRRTSRSSCSRTASRLLPAAPRLHRSRRRLHALQPPQPERSAGSTATCSRSAATGRASVKTEHADPRLLIVLKMFCGMLIFNHDARRHMRTLVRDIAAGKYTPKLEKQEADLYMNPRRVRWSTCPTQCSRPCSIGSSMMRWRRSRPRGGTHDGEALASDRLSIRRSRHTAVDARAAAFDVGMLASEQPLTTR